MLRKIRLWLISRIAVAPISLVLMGCGGTGHSQFTPTRDEARSSLEAALTAWRDGKPYGPIASIPPVNVADSAWQAGRKIESFQIGDEEDPHDGTKQFPVKLTLTKDKSTLEVRYVVNGRDPAWVFSETDYKRMIDMGNGPESDKGKSRPGKAGRR